MSIIQGTAKGVKDTGYAIDQSLRFNDDDSAYLSRTPSVAGNRKTWTVSFFVKFTKSNFDAQIAEATSIWSSDRTVMAFNGGKLQIRHIVGSSTVMYLETNQLFRDPSSWYHIVFSVDTTQATASDRVKIYVNGEQVTSLLQSTYPAQNTDTYWNNTVIHQIGRNGGTDYFDGYFAGFISIDGQALTPDNFGEFDETYGHWKPIAYDGTYGTNGFYLPYSFEPTSTHDILGDGSAVATYLLDGNASDLGGTYNGTATNVTYGTGKFGQASVFSGNGSVVYPINLGINPIVSVSLWVNFTSTSQMEILNFGQVADQGITILTGSSTVGTIDIHNSGGYRTASSGIYNDGNWHHLALWFDGADTAYLTIDNTETISCVAPSKTLTFDEMSLGENHIGGGYYTGKIDQVRLFNKALSSTEITTLYNESTYSNFDADASGNGNNFTATNLSATDIVKDSPTNNYCVWNPLGYLSNGGSLFGRADLSEGNLKRTTNADNESIVANMGVGSGKYYGEFYVENLAQRCSLAVVDISGNIASFNKDTRSDSGGSASGDQSWTTGDLISIAIDMDSSKVYFAKNGTWYNSSNPATNTGGDSVSVDSITFATWQVSTSTGNAAIVANFGQDSSFAGNKTSQGYTDANGIGDFYYAPPEGFLALCTANLPEPSVVPSEHMDVVTYTGNGSTQSISTDIKPEFTWIKCRSNASQNMLYDAIRGATKTLKSNQTDAEATYTNTLTSFDTNGISLGNHGDVNTSGWSYVSWNWKAGGTAVTNNDGTITSQVSANVDAGFSIVGYDGLDGVQTIGHGLNLKPQLIIVKNRTQSLGWAVYAEPTSSTDGQQVIYLNQTSAMDVSSGIWNSTAPTSSVFSARGGDIGNDQYVNNTGSNYIAYCFHSVEGYSKVGSYIGNGSADGTFVYCGFRPKYVMTKRTDSADEWTIFDIERGWDAGNDNYLQAESSNAENGLGGADAFSDPVSNGFKLRSSWANVNASGGTYLFIAFAEMPFSVGGGIAR